MSCSYIRLDKPPHTIQMLGRVILLLLLFHNFSVIQGQNTLDSTVKLLRLLQKNQGFVPKGTSCFRCCRYFNQWKELKSSESLLSSKYLNYKVAKPLVWRLYQLELDFETG